jgi:natural product biosynthesis luciferase-like monooxygenase protein
MVAGLSFGPVENPLGLPKLLVGNGAVIATDVRVLNSPSSAAPGTLTGIDDEAIHVATTTHDIALRKLLTIDGQPLSVAELAERHGLRPGCRLPMIDGEVSKRLTSIGSTLARSESFWVGRLSTREQVELPYANRTSAAAGPSRDERLPMAMPADLVTAFGQRDDAAYLADFVTTMLAAYVARLGGTSSFTLGFGVASTRRLASGPETFCAAQVPLRISLAEGCTVGEALRSIGAELGLVRKHGTYLRDVVARYPALKPLREAGGRPTYPVALGIAEAPDAAVPAPGNELTVLVSPDGSQTCWFYDPAVFSAEVVVAMQRQFGQFLREAAAMDQPLAAVSLLSDEERSRVLTEWNATDAAYPDQACIHDLFAAQAERTPDAVAVIYEDRQITYAQLDARANQLARHLQSVGVGPDSLVGIFMERTIDLVVAVLGIHKAGGAYVPLDPAYPPDRLGYMVEDSGLSVLLTHEHPVGRLSEHRASVVCLDRDWNIISRQGADSPCSPATSANLAYVIYTSGSTGKPKGVMVGHRNVVNFFAGMDERIGREPTGVWLAVTSLSFDISVLELLWTLTRGFTVILHADREKANGRASARPQAVRRDIAFSLSYFASDEGESVGDKYELLMEGAKFADRNGFAAVWTPERHFHAFGGLYPNPSVASAAIAAVTERVKIRAGSVVLPLHSPIRVAEEWSLVDNLSKGRVGISFAAGWQPNDFVLAPHNFADRKNVMIQDIATVRRLWQGEAVAVPGPHGQDVEVRTLPRPVQPELPVWLTAAGSPETFRLAGELGAGVLTHLLGQSVEELSEKVAIYRRAWRERGHAGDGHVTLMLHTFVGDDEASVRETVREPMKAYLRSSVDLIKKAAGSFPAFANGLHTTGRDPGEIFDSGELTEEEMDALLDHAFERYYKTSGLFGTPRTCLDMVDKLKEIGVDEIACLIDFGVASATALAHLEQLKEMMEFSRDVDGDRGDYSIAAQIERHGVTHLQCTPSMAGMLLADERTRATLHPLKKVMIGGEAFPPALAAQLTGLVSGDVINMYGPTETTIWSSTHRLDGAEGPIPIGRPIANTQLYILDSHLQPVPIGVPGELFIGGDGVVRGYLNRPELTAERFIRDPFSERAHARLYRTGDLARYRTDGNIEFLGRTDHQVKIRGYRIELGEIEALLHRDPAVKEAVVVAREDVPGDVRLVGYVVATGQAMVATTELRRSLKDMLPEYMVPSHIVQLEGFPLTPNAKVDRKALPAPDQVETKTRAAFAAPGTDLETTIAGVWCSALNVAQVGVNDNFFDLGGHSLLMVQVQQTLQRTLERPLAITDLFRFPTINSLAAHLSRETDDTAAIQESIVRADARRDMRDLMMRRRQQRQTAVR